MLRSLLILIAIIIFACSDNPTVNVDNILDIGTFNFEWLGDGINDVKQRTDEDYKIISHILNDLEFEILGVQEIENKEALMRVINIQNYNIYVSNLSNNQNIGIVYKKDIQLLDVKNYTPLIVREGKTKPGLIFSFKYNNLDAIVMVVHLKSTSRYDSTDELRQESIQIRKEQAMVLSNWIDSVLTHTSEKDLFIIGDFNDSPSIENNSSLIELMENHNVSFLTNDLNSCKYIYIKSIDHILISQNLFKRYMNSSVRMYDFMQIYPEEITENISDHCPVLATFDTDLPDDD